MSYRNPNPVPALDPLGRLQPGMRPSLPAQEQLGPWAVFFLLHIPLVMVAKESSVIATLHALATVAVGLSSLRLRNPERVVYVMGYVIASEPVWRVARAMIFYETGKYLIALLSILGILRYGLLERTDKAPLIYFLLLMPSFSVLQRFDRELISFNLSGPFALAACSMFLSTLRLSPRALGKLLLVTMGPIFGLAFIATFATVTTTINNYGKSKVASAGLGQNQASTIFGLGLVLAFFYLFIGHRNRRMRWMVATIGIWCGAQAGMTFSRGGLATAFGAIAVAGVFMLRDRRSRGTAVLRIGLLALLAVFVIVPQLDAFTGGAFTQRFTSTHLTGRDRIIKADIEAFKQNPLFGIGPGESKDYHGRVFGGRRFSSHTEYSRLLAEHGIWGVAAILALAWMSLRRVRWRPTVGTALAAGFTIWALIYMLHAAMRTASASFMFALGAAQLMAVAPHPAVMARQVHQRLRSSAFGQPLAPGARSAAPLLRSHSRTGNQERHPRTQVPGSPWQPRPNPDKGRPRG